MTSHWISIWEEKQIINRTTYVLWVCSCWNEKLVSLNNIIKWKSKSCCWDKENYKKTIKHWMSNTKIYNVFRWILQRCNDVWSTDYKNYWGRGIKCEWISFDEFYNDMFSTYKEWLTIERSDVNWNYCKDNCSWITKKEQANNKRNSNKITIDWITKNLAHWADFLWIKRSTVSMRYYVYWWSIERALNLNK